MSDPGRLVEEDDLGASLLSAALVLDAAQARERKAALIGAAATGTAITAALVTAKLLPKSLGAALLTKSVIVGVAIAVVSGGAVGALALSRSAPITAAPPMVAPRGTAIAAAPTAESRVPLSTPEITTIPEPSSAPSAAVRAAIPPVVAPEIPKRNEPITSAPPPAQSHLAEEVAALQLARSELRAGQPARALAVLDEHYRKFPHGLLGMEAEVLRIEAFFKSGNAGVASARAQRFIALHPNTPYAARLQGLAGVAPPSEDGNKP